METIKELQKRKRKNRLVIVTLAVLVLILAVVCLFVGSSNMTVSDAVNALLSGGNDAQSRIIWKIRVPRVLAAVIAGAGLSVAGLVMQTTLIVRHKVSVHPPDSQSPFDMHFASAAQNTPHQRQGPLLLSQRRYAP